MLFHLGTLRECFHHHDWARDRVLALAAALSDEQLDRPTTMGWGSLRDTLRHLYGAHRFWLERWRGEEVAALPKARTLGAVAEIWDAEREIARVRDALLDTLCDADLAAPVPLPPAFAPGTWPVGVMLLHLCNHSIHHRAQALNMLRHLGAPVPELDMYVWWNERAT